MTPEPDTRSRPHRSGPLVDLDGDSYYAVRDVDRMAPFLMSVVSDGDRWMFVSSTGNLTAGRGDASRALFPYVTDDRLNGHPGTAGPVTAIALSSQAGTTMWEPFRQAPSGAGSRTLYKSVVGNSVVFEEIDPTGSLCFRYRWSSSERLGFVRTATLVNLGRDTVRLDLLDGLLDILPWGLEPSITQTMGNLANAYKRNEIVDDAGRLAVFSLESRIVDRPEPSEALKATVAWSVGLPQAAASVSPTALGDFAARRPTAADAVVTGRPGAYLLRADVELAAGEEIEWHVVADVDQDQASVTALRAMLRTEAAPGELIASSLSGATEALVRIMAPADALQHTGDGVAAAHHFANVTYNVMRGGIPMSGYTVSTPDYARFLHDRNRRVAGIHRSWLEALPAEIERGDLLAAAEATGDPQLIRLSLEYLPFGFSRRHGDPSRPWNAFSIRVRDDEGNPILYYEGNWRDIFQNWEALGMSFPQYLPGMVSVFVNASTPDGFNPYRISRHGIDWEIPDPEDPWSNIGYWGDHQIVYLLRLLEECDRYLPGEVSRLLTRRWFAYADVPYRLTSYEDILRDPKETIHFDEEAARRTAAREEAIGEDGRLVCDADGDVALVTLAEKLIVPALAKLSNLVPGGGIWMNTQRPEWNDANNALVGHGLSMVTLYQLHRYVVHLRDLIGDTGEASLQLSAEVAGWLASIGDALSSTSPESTGDGRSRKALMDRLGEAFTGYRSRVDGGGPGHAVDVESAEVLDLCDAAISHLAHTIRLSRRGDGMYHSYNLLQLDRAGEDAGVIHLEPMLEGQVAVIESGVLTAEEKLAVLDSMFGSGLYRADQHTFMLYPVRRLPSFLEKNVIPPDSVRANPLMTALLDAGDRSVIVTDADGRARFAAGFSNRRDLESTLDDLEDDPAWSHLVAAHRAQTLDTYEEVFGHHAYTGRSGSMYAYEGIGSIYWHMVAKLLVAVQESIVSARRDGAPSGVMARLVDRYRDIRAGLGFNKTAEEFGAIPTDPYSHTPAHAGAQQPGMTGLVKEELLTRPLELGVRVDSGEITFDPTLLDPRELLVSHVDWETIGVDQARRTVPLGEGSLGFTLCQVPVVVSVSDGAPGVEVVLADGSTVQVDGDRLDRTMSSLVFARNGEVVGIRARLAGVAAL